MTEKNKIDIDVIVPSVEIELNAESQSIDFTSGSSAIDFDIATMIDNYNALSNRPKINNIVLEGNKTLDDLGAASIDDLNNLSNVVNTKQDKITISNKLDYSLINNTPTIPTKTSDLTNDSNFVSDNNYVHTDNNYTTVEKTKLAELENYDDSDIVQDIANLQDDINEINEKIPTQASSANQLADKAFVNSTVQTGTANFRGNWQNWASVPINASEYPQDYTGETTPSTNDYMVVQDASGYVDPQTTLAGTWRFKYGGIWSTDGRNGWYPEYQVNETPMTAAQLEALNSGATTTLINQITTNKNNIENLESNKQDKITVDNKLSYSLLTDKPTIPTAVSQLTNDSGFITNTDYATTQAPAKDGIIKGNNSYGINISDGVLTGISRPYSVYDSIPSQYVISKGILENVIAGKELINQTQLNTKQDTLVSGTNIKTINNESILGSGNIVIQGGGTGDFNELTNRPSYNGTVMSSSTDIPEVPTKTSDLTNDSGFITNTDYATQDSGGVVKLTSSYGTEFATDKKLRATIVDYANYNGMHNNAFIGKRTLENVITGKGLIKNTDYATQDNAGVIKISNGYGSELASDKKLRATVVDYSDYSGLHNNAFIGKRTLENVITGKELVNQTQLNTKQDATDNSLNTDNKTIVGGINEVNSLAKQCNLAKGYTNYQTLITELNDASSSVYNVGQSFLIQTLNVPDLWVISRETTKQTYTYTTDAQFIIDSSVSGGVQVGYYKLGQLETLKQDLTNYVTNTDFATASKGGVVRVSNSYGLQLSQGGSLYGLDKTYQEYTDGYNQMLIDKGTLENVIAGKELISNTDYATSSTGGVVKTSAARAITIDGNGFLRTELLTDSQYNDADNYIFIGKGTLENVIAGKGLVSNTDYATQTTAGVFKTHTYGARVNSNGDLYANSFTNWDNIKDLDNHYFVSKSILTTALGQLHIVKKTQAQYDALATKDDTALYIIVG